MDSDSNYQQQLSKRSRDWIANQLQLEEFSDSDSSSLQCAALTSFFQSLEQTSFAPNKDQIEAVEMSFGRPIESAGRYLQKIESEHLEQIDSIVADIASQLENQASNIDLEILEKRLNNFLQTRSTKVSHYANQVHKTVKSVDFSCVAPNPLSKRIAAAAFHIAAVRPSQRLETQNHYLQQISPLGVDVCGEAISGIDTRRFNLPFDLYQFFLEQLSSEELDVSDFIISSPVSATSLSLYPYKHTFGTLRPKSSGQNDAGWPAILTGAVIVFALVIMLLRATSHQGTQRTNRWKNIPIKHPVIIFDKNDPNKYAVKMVKPGREIGRPQRLKITPEHPGPFVNVPLSEIDPVEVTAEDIKNDTHYKVIKILSGIRSEGTSDD